MIRLGLQLTLHSGREAFVRLLVTAAAVAVGVTLLPGVLAEFHAPPEPHDRPKHRPLRVTRPRPSPRPN
jgi:hypothetical protein